MEKYNSPHFKCKKHCSCDEDNKRTEFYHVISKLICLIDDLCEYFDHEEKEKKHDCDFCKEECREYEQEFKEIFGDWIHDDYEEEKENDDYEMQEVPHHEKHNRSPEKCIQQLLRLKHCYVKVYYECGDITEHVVGRICNVTTKTVDIITSCRKMPEHMCGHDTEVVTIKLSNIYRIEWLDIRCSPCQSSVWQPYYTR